MANTNNASPMPEVPKGQGLTPSVCSRILFRTEHQEDGSIIVYAEYPLKFATRMGKSGFLTDDRENMAKEHMTELIECGMDGFRKAIKERVHSGDGIYQEHASHEVSSANVPHHLPRKAGGFDADGKGAA